jgi:hypothetical protein
LNARQSGCHSAVNSSRVIEYSFYRWNSHGILKKYLGMLGSYYIAKPRSALVRTLLRRRLIALANGRERILRGTESD